MADPPIIRRRDNFETRKSEKTKAETGKPRLLLTITEKHTELKRGLHNTKYNLFDTSNYKLHYVQSGSNFYICISLAIFEQIH